MQLLNSFGYSQVPYPALAYALALHSFIRSLKHIFSSFDMQ